MNKVKYLLSPWIFAQNVRLARQKKKLKFLGEGCSFSWDCGFTGPQNISIGSNCLFSRTNLATWGIYHGKPTGYSPKLTIGNDCYFGANCLVTCLNEISIGDGCAFGDNVLVSDNSHGDPKDFEEEKDLPVMGRKLTSKGPIHIGRSVWVGRNVSILGGVTIGDNAVIGANSVVTHDIEPNSVYAGIPARKIR